MERRTFLRHTGLAGILASGVAPALVRAEPPLRWRLASSFPKSHRVLFGASESFAQYIADATGGNFTISLHAPGELVPAFGVVDAIQQGTVECAHTASYYFFGKDETFALDCAVPFGMTARQMNAWMFDGNGLALLRDFFAGYQIVNFPCGNTTAQMGGWYRKEIRSVADLQGLKFRVGGFGGRVLAKLGVVPQNLPGGEVYQALEKGTIDATEFVGPYDDLQLGVHRVAPYYYYPAWWEGGAQISIYINADQWRSLSPTYQAIVTQAAAAAHIQCQARYDARNPQALKQLVAEGAKLSRFPKEVMDAAFHASREVYAKLEASNPNWRTIYPDFSRFLAEQVQWEAVAEANSFQYLAARTPAV